MEVDAAEDGTFEENFVATEKVDFVTVAEEENGGYKAWVIVAEDVSDVAFLEISVDEFPAENTLTDGEGVVEDTVSEDDMTESDIEGNTSKSNFSKFSGLGL